MSDRKKGLQKIRWEEHKEYGYRELESHNRKQNGVEKDYEWLHTNAQQLVDFKVEGEYGVTHYFH